VRAGVCVGLLLQQCVVGGGGLGWVRLGWCRRCVVDAEDHCVDSTGGDIEIAALCINGMHGMTACSLLAAVSLISVMCGTLALSVLSYLESPVCGGVY
jgi:hypothetical protein